MFVVLVKAKENPALFDFVWQIRCARFIEVSWKLVALGLCCCLGVVATGASLAVLSRLGETAQAGPAPRKPTIGKAGILTVLTVLPGIQTGIAVTGVQTGTL